MAYTPHVPVKPASIAELSGGLVEANLTLPKLVTRADFGGIAGQPNDTKTFKLKGRLPYRRMNFRDPRTNPIIKDIYKEGLATVTWGGYIYNATDLTDEQAQFDLDGWASLLEPQADAVAAGINQAAADLITSAPYEVVIKGAGTHLRSAIGEARKVLNRFRLQDTNRILVVGTDFEQAMLEDEKLTLAQYVGDTRADTALGQAILGRIAGFTVVMDLTVAADEAYAFVPSGFIQMLGAPMVPQSVGFGANIAKDGLALRWMRDYDIDYRTDTSLVDSWEGHNHVKDRFVPEHVLATTDPHAAFDPASMKQYFVRGLKLSLAGVPADSIYPAATTGKPRPSHGTGASNLSDAAEVTRTDQLRAETEISSANPWTPPAP